jgi:hypothetical protein
LNTSPSEPLWLDLGDVLDIHKGQLASFGGADGIRDQDLIESALARPQNMFFYENVEDALSPRRSRTRFPSKTAASSRNQISAICRKLPFAVDLLAADEARY